MNLRVYVTVASLTALILLRNHRATDRRSYIMSNTGRFSRLTAFNGMLTAAVSVESGLFDFRGWNTV